MQQQAAEFIRAHEDFLLIAHVSPDGDTLGSCLALYCALQYLNKRAQIVCEDPIPALYRFLPGAELVQRPEAARPSAAVIAVDCADAQRAGKCSVFLDCAAYTLCIDHHGTNTRYAQVNFVQRAGATGELIFQLLCVLGVPVDQSIAGCLYTAISTDTGNFSYRNTTPDTFRIMAELLESGIDISELNRRLFRSEPCRKVKLRALAITKLQLYCENSLGIAALSLQDFADCGATAEDNEGVIDNIRDIDTIEVAALLRECEDGTVRVSLRGKHYADVSRVALRFRGGGHRLAAGCTVTGTLQEVMDALLPSLIALVQDKPAEEPA